MEYAVFDYKNQKIVKFSKEDFELYENIKEEYCQLRDYDIGDFVDHLVLEKQIPLSPTILEFSKKFYYSERGYLFPADEQNLGFMRKLPKKERKLIVETAQYFKQKFFNKVTTPMMLRLGENPDWSHLLEWCIFDEIIEEFCS